MSRKKRSRQATESVFYVIEIESSDWGYSFGIDDSKHFNDPYLEFRHLQILGRLLRPMSVKAERTTLTLMPENRLNEENRQDDSPKAVGSLMLYRGLIEGLLPIPADALGPVLQVLIAEAGALHRPRQYEAALSIRQSSFLQNRYDV